MSQKGSVAQKGGKGTNYEQKVQAAFITTLAIGGIAPTIPANRILEVATQVTRKGYDTDDLMIVAESASRKHRLLAQVKTKLTISDNEEFNKVIAAFWADFNNEKLFDQSADRLLLIKSQLLQWEKEHLQVILDWARTHATPEDFLAEVNRIAVKKEKLSTLTDALRKANDNQELTQEELWNFLKCFHILSYDFTELNGLSKSNILNLIRLSRNAHSSITEEEIWSSICQCAADLNENGGSINQDNIKDTEFFKHFSQEKISQFFGSIRKLASNSKLALDAIYNTIGGFHLDRTEQNQLIEKAILNNQFTIVTGKAGVGKSATIKSVLQNYQENSILFFKADEFNVPSVAHILNSHGVHESIEDIFSCLSLLSDKIIFVDSLEKLLEADATGAFQQLLTLLVNHPDIKLIASARQYSLNPVFEKYQITAEYVKMIEVPTLQDFEIEILANQFPQLSQAVHNQKLKSLIEIPKYVDLILLATERTTEDFSLLSIKEFKTILWNHLIKNYSKTGGGFPARREDVFMTVAVQRAKEMKLFVKLKEADEAALELLVADEIIIQDGDKRRYAPSHDILEDWSLVRYVEDKNEDCETAVELFSQLGNEPAIRRAFRLWIENELIDDESPLIELVRETLELESIEPSWQDELLVAIFKSDHSKMFFEKFGSELLANNASLLERCVRLIRTACKEPLYRDGKQSLLIPSGSGWGQALAFINEHKASLSEIRLTTLGLLDDWEYKLLFDKTLSDDEAKEGKGIALFLIGQIRAADKFWFENGMERHRSGMISLIFNLSYIARNEVSELLEYAIEKRSSRNFELRGSFSDKVIELALAAGSGTRTLARELPDSLVSIAWKEWKLRSVEPKEIEIAGISIPNRPSDGACWGLKTWGAKFFPSSIYKTMIFNLLGAHPQKGLDFVIELLNYSVEHYVKADCDYKRDFYQIEIDLLNGAKRKYWGAWELWGAYRGITKTDYLIACALMSLEKYLLMMAQHGTEVSKENLDYLIGYMLEKSNNICPASIIVSVAMAHPNAIGESVLPIFGVKEFYDWDLSRSTGEISSLAPYDQEITYAQEERIKSNNLPHRKKYSRGLRDFALDYQFNVRTLNEQLFKVFDLLKGKSDASDFQWNKTLTEMDVRNHKIGEYDEKLGGFPIAPEYSKEQIAHMVETTNAMESEHVSIRFSNILLRALEENGKIPFETWEEIFEQYAINELVEPFYSRPITLALVGLRDFKSTLDVQQKKWCRKYLMGKIGIILQNAESYNFELFNSINLVEKEVVLTSFHILLDSVDSDIDRIDIIRLLIYLSISPLAHYEMEPNSIYLRTVFFKDHSDVLKQVWKALIKYGKFRKANPYDYNDQESQQYKTAREKEEEHILRWANGEDLGFDYSRLSFDVFGGDYLARALLLIPSNSNDNEYYDFIRGFIPMFVEDLKNEAYSSYRSKGVRQIHYKMSFSIQKYLTEFLLETDTLLAKEFFLLLINPLYQMEAREARIDSKGVHEFIEQLLRSLILKANEITFNTEDQDLIESVRTNFWNLWQALFLSAQESEKVYFRDLMLLSIHWKEDASDWKIFRGYKQRYYEIMGHFGTSGLNATLNVFSTIGEETFLPDGLQQIVGIIKDDSSKQGSMALISVSAERLIDRLHDNHILNIKKNSKLLNDFIWLLDRMIELGSSKAFTIREHVITYKRV